jgi:hypothetical protein
MAHKIRGSRSMKDQYGNTVRAGDEVLFTKMGMSTNLWRKGIVVRISPEPRLFKYLGGMAEIVAEGETVQDGMYPRFGQNIRRI